MNFMKNDPHVSLKTLNILRRWQPIAAMPIPNKARVACSGTSPLPGGGPGMNESAVI